ncbi:hypothetical protein STEG23_034468, partial [Scotinomys teguina]
VSIKITTLLGKEAHAIWISYDNTGQYECADVFEADTGAKQVFERERENIKSGKYRGTTFMKKVIRGRKKGEKMEEEGNNLKILRLFKQYGLLSLFLVASRNLKDGKKGKYNTRMSQYSSCSLGRILVLKRETVDRSSLVTVKDTPLAAFGFHDDIPMDVLTVLFCPPFVWHIHPNRFMPLVDDAALERYGIQVRDGTDGIYRRDCLNPDGTVVPFP